MAKIVCEKCESVFQFEVVKNMKNCPVCGELLFGGGNEPDEEVEKPDFRHPESLSFGDDVELGEFDSFDEDKRDYWWYSIRTPGEVWEGITYTDGTVYTNCAKCGHFVGSAPYPIARTGDYLLIDPRFTDRCGTCGNEMKNHILSKRPDSWVDPRQRDMWEKDYTNLARCPICSSTKVHKISMTNKAASIIAFGIFSAGHVSKTYKCDICGSKF